MTRAFVLAIPVLALLVSGWSGTVLKAQDNKPTRGRVAGGGSTRGGSAAAPKPAAATYFEDQTQPVGSQNWAHKPNVCPGSSATAPRHRLRPA